MPNVFQTISLERLVVLFELLFENTSLENETDPTFVFLRKYYKLIMNVHDYKKLREYFLRLLFENNIDFDTLELSETMKEIIFILYNI